MQISFENYTSIDLIETNNFVLFVSEEYIQNYIEAYNNCDNKEEKSVIKIAVDEYDFRGKNADIVIILITGGIAALVIITIKAPFAT